MFDNHDIDNIFRGEIIGQEIILLDSTTSTNDVAIEIGSKEKTPEGTVIIADEQKSGRGRFGRNWISPPGVNLYFTVILKPTLLPENISIITLAAAVAVASSVREYTGLGAEIKWPNDILIHGRKIGGILVEMKSMGKQIDLMNIGIGLNVNMQLDIIPEDIRPFTTSLKTESKTDIDRCGLLNAILSKLEQIYKMILNGDKQTLINEWIRLNCTIGKEVSVQGQNSIIRGVADSVNDKGELLIRLESGKIETVNSGEVKILTDAK
jgi:BirA family biotin operon repressor/biotin-[acetyl-CoA-carboxylase] ligase